MKAFAIVMMTGLALSPAAAWSAEPLERHVLVVGANTGGRDRPQLKYAISDAERFARVMVDLGGVAPANETILRQPKLRDLTDALDTLARRISDGRRAGRRTEMIVYYSGHADELGILLADDRYSYRSLRDRLDQIPADVRIAVLDACSSGAFTRVKSGKPRPPFLVDESSDMRGHAFLTSSSESEAAQESDRIRASYFTHYLVSGLRGAADSSGDGKVTLNEAYQFAFNETLGRTVDSKGGAQHPSYDISLSGTGDVVMTDVRQTTATLVLGESLEGRFFVRTSSQDLVVELYKPRGRSIELAVEAGIYDVRLEREKGSLMARAEVTDGSRMVLEPRQFGLAPPAEAAQRRGGVVAPPRPRFAVSGRNRLELMVGMWRAGHDPLGVTAGTTADVLGGLGYTRWVREDLAMSFSIAGVAVQEGAVVSGSRVAAGSVAAAEMLVGARWNPFTRTHALQAVKPYVSVAAGPIFGLAESAFVAPGTVTSTDTVLTTFGAQLGAGVDMHLARSFSIGLEGGYHGMLGFSQPIGLRDSFNGPHVTVSFGWLFGKGD